MRNATQRVFLSGLTLGPAVASVAVPLSTAGSLLASAAGAGAGFVALVSSFAPEKATFGTLPADVLMSPAMRQQLEWELPDWPSMQGAIAEAIRIQPVEREPAFPPDRATAIAQILRRLLAQLDCSTPTQLAPDETLVLYVTLKLFETSPEDAGRLAQYYNEPHVLIDLREEVDRIDRDYQSFEAGHLAYLATQRVWEGHSRLPVQGPLLDSILSLDTPDIDLWHRVILEHDPTDHEQRNAALWCLRQPQCDRATIAAYMSRIAQDGSLIAAVRADDIAYLEAIKDILAAWNLGEYRMQMIGLDAGHAVKNHAGLFSSTLDEIQRITGEARWPDPFGLFVAYEGRAPRSRDNWRLDLGRLTEEPKLAHYVDLPEKQVL